MVYFPGRVGVSTGAIACLGHEAGRSHSFRCDVENAMVNLRPLAIVDVLTVAVAVVPCPLIRWGTLYTHLQLKQDSEGRNGL